MNMSLNKKLLKEIQRNKQLMFGNMLLSEQPGGIFGKISEFFPRKIVNFDNFLMQKVSSLILEVFVMMHASNSC